MSAGDSGRKRRRAPGIKRPDPKKLAVLRGLLESEPGLTKAALARRAGLGRSTLPLYLKHIRDDVAKAAAQNDATRDRLAMTHVDLVARVDETAREVRDDLTRLRAAGPVGNAAVIFSGVRALVQVERLVGELLGIVKPPTQNTYILQVRALMEQSVPPSSLSTTTRAVLGVEGHAAPE